MKNDRWRNALHEAGHAAMYAGHGIESRAMLLSNGGMVSIDPPGPSPVGRLYAMVLQAGQEAEKLADEAEPPEPPDGDESKLPQAGDVLPKQRANISAGFRAAVDDDLAVARAIVTYCHSHGQALDVDAWGKRLKLVQDKTQQFVRRNKAAIIGIARELYLTGVIDIVPDDEGGFEISRKQDSECSGARSAEAGGPFRG